MNCPSSTTLPATQHINDQDQRTLQVLKPVLKVAVLPLMLVVPVLRDIQLLSHVAARLSAQVAAALCQR